MPWDPEEGLSFLTEGQKNKSPTRGIKTPTPLSPSLRPSRTKLTINQYKFSVLMKNKITLLFAALMMTLGVSAQEGATVEERGAAKGYYPFATKVTEMEQITSLDQLTDGMEIMIKHSHEGTDQDDHEGSYITINSLDTGGENAYHNVFMHNIPTGVGVWTTDAVGDGSYRLKSAHMTIVDGAKCYLGAPKYDYNVKDDVVYTTSSNNCTYEFELQADGRWALKYTNVVTGWNGAVLSKTTEYLCVTSTSGKIKIVSSSTLNANCYFNVYQVKEKSAAQTKYVEATVKLTGAAGNVFTTDHAGWNDFYEFSTESYDTYLLNSVLNNYGVILSNIYYHEESNEITGGIRFPFSVSGKIAQIPVHLCPSGNANRRFTVGDENTVKVITSEDDGWYKNQENQWYIYPQFDEEGHMVYSIQNVKTGQYLYSELNSADLKLSDAPTYFKLHDTAPFGKVRFGCPYVKNGNKYYSFLCENSSKGHTTTTASTSTNFLVPRVSGEEAGGYDAIGFTRTYHSDTYFWDGGEIAMDDAPADLKAVFEHEDHEGYNTEGSQHHIYTANTGIYVPKMGDVTVTFKYLSGTDRLTILGVDIVNALGEIVSYKYHLGYAGVAESENVYVVKDVPVGNYFLRYWVCNRTDWENEKNHDLSRNSGKIIVTGADYYLTYSDAPTNGAFSSNSTWYRMRLSDGLEKYISAQPNYVDADNNLMVTNDTPPTDYAGLWTIVGDAENGYKFYNRAWGPKYAMKTVDEDGAARTYMVPAAEASTYDIVQQDRSKKDYKFYVKLHGTANNYLQDFGGYNSTGYLSTWNSEYALGDNASVMTFETVNEEGFANRTETVKNTLAEKWTPWTAEPEVAAITGDFAQLMLNRNSFALLDGKVFKFANADDEAPRKDMLLTVNSEGKGAGVDPTNTATDYMQFIDNGNGTFKLFHIATARYLGVPDGAVTTTKSSEAAAYTYMFQDANNKQQLTFQTSGQTLHLKNVDNYILMNHGDADDASRWTVFYGETEAQELGAVAIEAQKMLEEITSEEYRAKAGQQGYASPAQIEAYQKAIQGLSGKSVEEAKNALTAAMKAIEDAENNIRYLNSLTQLSNTGIYGIHCARGPLAYVAGNSSTQLSTPKKGSTEDITANVVANENEQFAILRTDHTPAGWYYLYNITTQKFVSKDFTLTENPVCAVNFRDIYAYDTNYRWEVWFGEIINGEKVDQKLNVNQGNGLILESGAGMDAGNKFRIEYAETNEAKTAPALDLIIALETAKAEATAFLNSTPETVGYPVVAERTTFANAIVAATSVAEVQTAKTAFVTTSSIVMPEDGKAYKISAWWRNETRAMTFVETEDASIFAGSEPAYVPSTSGEAVVFVCRDLGDGEYAFVSDNGYYLGWLADGKKNNTSQSFSVNGHDNTLKVQKAVASNQSTILRLEEVFGTFNILGKNADASGNYYHMMFSQSSKNYHSAGQDDAYYGDDAHTVFYKFEEVEEYTLNKVTLTAISESDKLINGLEGAIGTFSAPYATVIPEGVTVTAYYANATNAENSSANLEVVGGAIPAGEGVILVGKTAGQVVMLPATSEDQATLENNKLIGTGATSVPMQTGDFILARGNEGIGFYQATGTLRAGKAYIQFGGAVNSLVLRFGGNTTDIDAVTTVTPSNDELIYDIYGRRVTEVKKGNIYIKNGKKFIVK